MLYYYSYNNNSVGWLQKCPVHELVVTMDIPIITTKERGRLLLLHYTTYTLNKKADWVVFLHGFGGNSNIWYKQVDAFKKHFNLLLIDLSGHGGSAHYRPDRLHYTEESVANDIVKVLDALSIKKAHFAGISLGSIILHGLQQFAPGRIKSMILGGAITRFTPFAKVLLKTGGWIKGFVPYMWLYKLFAYILMPRKHHERSRSFFIQEAKKLHRKEFMKWYQFVAKAPDVFSKMNIENCNIPKFYIMGAQDYMFVGPVKHDTIKDKLASVHIIERCGHVCNIEKHEEFNEMAIGFFKDCRHEAATQGEPVPLRRKRVIIA